MILKNEVRETDLTLEQLFQNLRLLLASDKQLTLTSVPPVVHDDLFNYMVGKTVNLDDSNTIIIHKHDFKNWIDKLRFKGFDYELKVKC